MMLNLGSPSFSHRLLMAHKKVTKARTWLTNTAQRSYQPWNWYVQTEWMMKRNISFLALTLDLITSDNSIRIVWKRTQKKYPQSPPPKKGFMHNVTLAFSMSTLDSWLCFRVFQWELHSPLPVQFCGGGSEPPLIFDYYHPEEIETEQKGISYNADYNSIIQKIGITELVF